jgi:hypothetical protein
MTNEASAGMLSDPRVVKTLRLAFLVLIYVLAASAGYNGFYGKWGLRDTEPRFSIVMMLEGRAERPFVYRQLAPQIANTVDRIMPGAVKAKLTKSLIEPSNRLVADTRAELKKGVADNPAYALRYDIVYLLGFGCFVAAMGLMRWLCLRVGASELAATATPVLFALAFPTLLAVGGYVYDFSELLLFFAAVCLSTGRWRWLIIPLAVVGAYNKESYLFFVLSLAPLLITSRRDYAGMAVWLLSLPAAGLTYLLVRSMYAGNPGGAVEYQLIDNLKFYANPLSLLKITVTYGLPYPAGYSFVSVAAIAVTAILGWRALPDRFRRYAIVAAIINVPLTLLFAFPGEMRNLSLLYPSFVLLMAGAIDGLNPVLASGGAKTA